MTLAKLSSFDQPPLQVLLIDDDEDSYVLTRDLLSEVRGQRYVLDWAKSAPHGVAAVEAGNFDIALVDFYLGAYTGDALITELRRRKSLLPLILLTSEDLLQNDLAVMQAGADEFLIKGNLNSVVLERTIRFSVERSQQAAALRASEERFRELFRSSLDAVIVTEPNGSILAANPAAEVLLRLSQADIIARGRLALLAAESRETATQLDARLQAGAFRDEILLRRGDGSTFIGEITVAPVNEASGGRASMIIRDVSARRATEHRTVSAERRLRRFETGGPFVAGTAIVAMLCLMLLGNAVSAVAIGVVVIASQTWLRISGTRRRTFAFSSLAEWREHAVDARRGLSRYAEYLQVDPESGLGTKLSMQRAVERQIACYQRTGETFCLVLVEIADPESPRRELPAAIVQSASKLLSVATTVEEPLCRINSNTFGILLPGRNRGLASEFIEQFRQRLSNKLRGDLMNLKVVAGRAEISDNTKRFEELLESATDDLENYDRDLSWQISEFASKKSKVS
ncbi:MAG: PAS domain S-box protein [bacterium]